MPTVNPLSLGVLGEIDLTDWLRGLIGGIVSGGANAIIGGFGVAMVDPTHFGVGTADSFKVMGTLFLFNGLLGGAAFLAKKPVPDIRTVTNTVQTTERRPEEKKVVVSTTEETHVEPLDKGTRTGIGTGDGGSGGGK